ncbi:MAG: flagellar basal-body rod protein FlgF [Azorhizobium sp. 35-67-15]|nr:MAG: flagellar basal-body rod protein FlgF [Azorhizobium sp. 35-67-15]
MSSSAYVALSAQMATERRLATVANNIANANTAGFRAEHTRFETMVSEAGGRSVAFTSAGETYTSLRSGPVNYTGNPLDVAVQGEGWLAVKGPDGTAYTRDGRMHLDDQGQLRSVNNYPVLDNSGGPITLNPAAGPIGIGSDGSITQGGNTVGSIGVFTIPASAKLTRGENCTVIPDGPAEPVRDFTHNKVAQGYVEGSNVDPIMEMTRLILVQRAFEQAATAIQQSENGTDSAIRTLGPT